MTSRLRTSRDYAQPVGAFATALADPAFHRARLDVGGGGEVVAHRAEAGRIEVVVRQPVPTAAVPAPIAALLAGSLVLTRSERWTLGSERLDGLVDVVVPRAPLRAEGSMSVSARGPEAGCRLLVEVDVEVTVPFAGALIEPGVVAGIRSLTGVEHERISEWLAAHP